MIGDHSRIFWNCLVLQEFWHDLKEEIGKTLSIPVDPVLCQRSLLLRSDKKTNIKVLKLNKLR